MTGTTLIMAATLLAALAILAAAVLKGWQGWLALKHRELDCQPRERDNAVPPGFGRIELADLRERIRKVEAIAAGVDL